MLPIMTTGIPPGYTGIPPGYTGIPLGNTRIPDAVLQAYPAEDVQQFDVQWESHAENVVAQFVALRQSQDFVDVTLTSEGKQLKAHKLVLSTASPYFKQLLKSTPGQHPVIFFCNIGFRQLEALVEYMYTGKVIVSEAEMPSLLRAGEWLQIHGFENAVANNIQQTQQNPAFAPRRPQRTASEPRMPMTAERVTSSSGSMSEPGQVMPLVDGTLTQFMSMPANPPVTKKRHMSKVPVQSGASSSEEDLKTGPNSNGESVPGTSAQVTRNFAFSKQVPGQVESGSGRTPGSLASNQCPYCEKVLRNVSSWRKHVIMMHLGKERAYKCQHCSGSFRSVRILKSHCVRVHKHLAPAKRMLKRRE